MRAGGIGACSVGTYRKDFSVTFLQRRAKGIAPAFGDWRVEPLADLCLFATDDARARNSRRGFGNIYAVRGTETQPYSSDRSSHAESEQSPGAVRLDRLERFLPQ